MRSRANIAGAHPIHVMLIPFPLAFLTGSFVADAAGVVLGVERLWLVGGYLAVAGVAMALVAAVPGLIDYRYTVPPEGEGRETATKHMLANLAVVGLFGTALLLRGGLDAQPGGLPLVLEAAGAGLLGLGGWLGGKLAYRLQIGVDNVYARGGEWREVTVSAKPGEAVAVVAAGELEVDQMMLVRVDGRRIVVARTADGYTAFDDACTHAGGSLAGGVLACGRVQCPWHGSQFDAATGEVRAGPAEKRLRTYEVRSDGRKVELVL